MSVWAKVSFFSPLQYGTMLISSLFSKKFLSQNVENWRKPPKIFCSRDGLKQPTLARKEGNMGVSLFCSAAEFFLVFGQSNFLASCQKIYPFLNFVHVKRDLSLLYQIAVNIFIFIFSPGDRSFDRGNSTTPP